MKKGKEGGKERSKRGGKEREEEKNYFLFLSTSGIDS